MMAPALKQEEEIRIQHFKNQVTSVAREFELKKNVRMSNLNTEGKKGMDQLKQRIQTGEMVSYVTDKNSSWACDTVENYRSACEIQLQDEKIEEVNKEQHISKTRNRSMRTLWL